MDVMVDLPKFSSIIQNEIKSSLDRLLVKNCYEIEQLVKIEGPPYTWKTFMQPLEDISERLHRYWAPISHLNSVVNTPELREIYHTCLPKLANYFTKFNHHQGLYRAIQSIANSTEYQKLNNAQRKVIDNNIRDFKLAGVTLSKTKKRQFAELTRILSKLQNQFEENLLDATQNWHKHIMNQDELHGIPENAVIAAREAAEKQCLEGWLFTLETPSYLSALMHADSRRLRQEMYTAFVTRASDQGPNAKKWDNTVIITQILNARLKLAKLLGFVNFAEYSLATKMVKSSKQVILFINQLVKATLQKAKQEFQELSEFSRKELGIEKLEAWDTAYAAEKFRQRYLSIAQEDMRPYFPEKQVIQGLFKIVNRLFQITVKPIISADVWHPDVNCYAVYDNKDQLRAYFYLDLYARENKRGGAWMDNHCPRRRLSNGNIQLPIAFIICNLKPPTANQPSLFSHDEVVTLFHEFGHALQHMLTKIDYAEISGIHGIPWDAVELASQFLEYWAWHKEPLLMITQHYQTGEPLPDELFQRLYKTKHFHIGLQTMRQLEFSFFDIRLHTEFDPTKKNQTQQILDEVRKVVCIVPIPDFNRFQNSFSHIFSGGYAAGYYGYKWAEVMAADAFSLFEEKGIFDQESAYRFSTCILESGGLEDPLTLFKAFRGREPKVETLLQQRGMKIDHLSCK